MHKRGLAGSEIPNSSLPPLHPPQTTQSQQIKRRKMLEDTLLEKNFDYCDDIGGFVPPLSPNQGGNTPPYRGKPRAVPQYGSINALDFEIAEKQLQLLQWRRVLEREQGRGNCSAYSSSEMNNSSDQPSYARDQKSRRQVALKQQ